MRSPAITGTSEEECRTCLQSVTSTEEHTNLCKSSKELRLNRQVLAVADTITPVHAIQTSFYLRYIDRDREMYLFNLFNLYIYINYLLKYIFTDRYR